MAIEISRTIVHKRQAYSNDVISNEPFSFLNFSRLMEARLQAVSSKNIYSEQGFDARIRPDCGQVCHSLMVVSYCNPGSAHAQAA